MYEIRPETVLTFLNDRNVRFPRFQRKQTWKDEQNLKLAISIFKSYPVGVTIINKEDFGHRVTRWLLDGRQRRNALKLMLDNPENIYMWAKRFFRIQSSDDNQDIKHKFWNGIEDYLNFKDQWEEEEEEKLKKIGFNNETIEEDYIGDFELDDFTKDEQGREESLKVDITSLGGNLAELLKIIQVVHKIKIINKTEIASSGFTKPFDFSKIITNLSYIESSSGQRILNGRKLTTFIKEYRQYLSDTYDRNNIDIVTFKNFILSRYKLNDKEEDKLKLELEKNWENISESMDLIEMIENRLQEAKIGIIETKDLSASDSQMIFKLINDEGTPLSAVEILSSKPTWNIVVKNPSSEVKKYAEELYSNINTDSTNIVRWDYPATLYNRLNYFKAILPYLSYEKKLEKNITLGFKIISGIFQGAIKKEDLSTLSSLEHINWAEDVDKIVFELCKMGQVLSESNYFKCLISWNSTLMELTSDAITLNFIFIMYKDYLRKGSPIGRGSQTFVNNAVKLVDKLVFEYVTKKWRGSSDSKISQNLKEFESADDIFTTVSKESWEKLLTDILYNFKIEEDNIKFTLMKTLVIHRYCIAQIMGPNDINIGINIDHLIPRSLFNDKDLSKDSLFNLCPIPQKENIKKSNSKLNKIDDQWLIQQIEKYSLIPQNKFVEFSNPEDYEKLREYRKSFYLDKFFEDRTEIFNS